MSYLGRFLWWMWGHRWPGAPLTLVVLITIILQFYNSYTLDTIITITTVTALVLLILALTLFTNRNSWGGRSTGILIFALGDLLLYGAFILPPRFGHHSPHPNVLRNALRACLMVGPTLLILNYSDFNWNRFAIWRTNRRDHGHS